VTLTNRFVTGAPHKIKVTDDFTVTISLCDEFIVPLSRVTSSLPVARSREVPNDKLYKFRL